MIPRSTAIAAILLLLTVSACDRDVPGVPDTGQMEPREDAQAAPDGVQPPDEAVPAQDPVKATVVDGRQQVTIMVTATAFDPPMVELEPHTPADLTFIRTSERSCGDAIGIPTRGITTDPLLVDQPATLSFVPETEGVFLFVCGVNVIDGRIVVQR